MDVSKSPTYSGTPILRYGGSSLYGLCSACISCKANEPTKLVRQDTLLYCNIPHMKSLDKRYKSRDQNFHMIDF